MSTFEGTLIGSGLRIGIAVSRWNELITMRLFEGACDCLYRHGVDETAIDIAWTPGSFELPLICRTMAETGRYDAIIAIGAVIRGATFHYDHIANAVTNGIAQVSQQTGVPCIFCVLTTENIDQAIERAGTKGGNKGFDAAMAAIETVTLLRAIKSSH